jgi:uncharacterized protein (TIGR03437 family)
VTSITFDDQGNIYAGVLLDSSTGARDTLLTRSADGGHTWTNIPLPDNPVLGSGSQTTWVSIAGTGTALSVLVAYQTRVLYPDSASAVQSPPSQLDFYGSNDRGVSWFSAFGIGQGRPPVRLLSDSSGGNLFIAAQGLLSSASGGATWQSVTTSGTDFHAAAFISGGTLLLGGEKGVEADSILSGAFSSGITNPPLGQVLTIAVDSSNTVWGGSPQGLLAIQPGSPSQGSTVPGIGPTGAVVVASSGSGNIFASGLDRVYRSLDHGAHFSSQIVIPAGELHAPLPPLILDAATGISAYVAGQHLYHTTDSGAAWTALATIDPDPTHVAIALARAPSSSFVLYAATACLPEIIGTACPAVSLIWRSTNAGGSWTAIGSVAGYVNRLAVDPRQTTTVYAVVGAFPGGASITAGLVAGDILQIPANGQATSIRGNLPRSPINSLVIDPASLPTQLNLPATTMYLATDAGVFVSFNVSTTGGELWMDLSGSATHSLPPSPVTDLWLGSDGTLVAGTFGRGFFTTSVAGSTTGIISNPLSLDVKLIEGTATTTGVVLTNASIKTASWGLAAPDSWVTLPEPSGTMNGLSSATVPVRITADGLRTGTYTSRLQLFSGPYAQNVLLHVQITPAPAKITVVGSTQLTGTVGATLPPLQVLVSDSNQQPLPGVSVIFTITAGDGSLSDREVDTNVSGIANTSLTLPATAGVVTVTATVLNLSASFTITVLSPPSLLADSIIDGVTLNAYTSLGPGSVVTISGQNLAAATLLAGPALPDTLGNTKVLLTTASSDIALPLLSVSAQHVSAVLPLDLSPGTYGVRLQVGSAKSNSVQIPIAAFDPGIFTVNGSGHGPGIFVKDDGSLVTATNPADRGENVTFYSAGLSTVSPASPAGQPGATIEPLNRTIRTPRVVFDTYQAQVVYSGLVPGMGGRYQVTVRVPALLSPSNSISVSLTIGGFASNRVTIPVR